MDDPYVVYFFIPLPEPIGLPTDAVMTFGDDEDPSDVLARTAPGDDLDPGVMSHRSLVIHKLQWTQPAYGVDDHLVARVESVLPWLTSKSNPTPVETAEPLPALTLVEIAVLTNDPDDIGSALEQALDSIRAVQKAYYAVTKTPTTLVRPEGLPFVVMFAIAKNDETGKPIEHQGLGTFLCHDHPQFARDDVDFDGPFGQALSIITSGGPMNAYLDAIREARVADLLRGEYKTAAIYYASAAEVLLQDLLLHLMWEEGLSPQQASDEFDTVRAGLRSRVRTLYQPRLKGNWDLKRDPLRAWDIDTAELRNRAVHAGYEPTLEECRASFAALMGLEQHVCNRLASNAILPKYTRTAMATMGEPGLTRRNAYSAAVRRLVEDETQPNWSSRFERWRERFNLIRRDLDGKDVPTPDAAASDLVVVCRARTLTWVRRHWQSRKAVLVEPVDADEVAAVVATATNLASIEGFVGSTVVSPLTQTRLVGDWVWDSELIPEAEDGPSY